MLALMKCILSHTTALQWFMRYTNPRHGSNRTSRASLAGASTPRPGQAEAIRNSLWLDTEEPLDVLVASEKVKQTVAGVRCHVCSGELPVGSLIPIVGPGDIELYICCPELVFIQMASRTDPTGTIYYGTALSSEYRLDPVARGGVALREHTDEPLTTPARIATYLDRAAGVRGCKLAEKAQPYLLGRARSPKEAALGLMLSLPVRLGGYHLGAVTLNERIEIPDGIDRFGVPRTSTRYPDIIIRNRDRTGRPRAVAADYDAFAVHADAHAMARDARRRNELATMEGFTYFTITTDEARDFEYMEKLAERMRLALGQRKQPYLSGHADSVDNRALLERTHRAQYDFWARFVRDGVGV